MSAIVRMVRLSFWAASATAMLALVSRCEIRLYICEFGQWVIPGISMGGKK